MRATQDPHAIAYFLPQFYSTPENDRHWGVGFTEWTNVRRSSAQFRGHRQPVVPELGYYDLSEEAWLGRLIGKAQLNGITGFAYWHYWFGDGEKTLSMIPEQHLRQTSLRHCMFLAWDNSDWTKRWVGDDRSIIFRQRYDARSANLHFDYLRDFIADERYVRVDGRPVFQVLRPQSPGALPYVEVLERRLIEEEGAGFHWLFPFAKRQVVPADLTHSLVGFPPGDVWSRSVLFRLQTKLKEVGILNKPIRVPLSSYLRAFRSETRSAQGEVENYIPCVLSGWDTTPRYAENGVVILGRKSELLREQLAEICRYADRPRILLVKAWNEWAEGNVLEPLRFQGDIDYPAVAIRDWIESLPNPATGP